MPACALGAAELPFVSAESQSHGASGSRCSGRSARPAPPHPLHPVLPFPAPPPKSELRALERAGPRGLRLQPALPGWPLLLSKRRHWATLGTLGLASPVSRGFLGSPVLNSILTIYGVADTHCASLPNPLRPPANIAKQKPATLEMVLSTDHVRANAPVSGQKWGWPYRPGLAAAAVTPSTRLCPGTLENLGASWKPPLLRSANSRIYPTSVY